MHWSLRHLSHMAWKTNGLLFSHCSISLSNADLFKTASNIGLPNICGELLNVQIWSLGHGLWGCFSWSKPVPIPWACLLTWHMHFNVCVCVGKGHFNVKIKPVWIFMQHGWSSILKYILGQRRNWKSHLMGYHFSDLTALSLKPISVLAVTYQSRRDWQYPTKCSLQLSF